jgi:hypothetical protein
MLTIVMAEQVAFFCLSAVATGAAFIMWRRIEDRQGLWHLYGLFTGLSCLGSILGAMSLASNMQASVNLYTNDRINYRYWQAAHDFFYGASTPFMVAAKLMVLDRMSEFAVPKQHSMSKHLSIVGRVSIAVTALAGIVNLGANICATVFAVDIGNSLSSGATSNSTYVKDKIAQRELADAVQYSFDIVRLVVCVVAFAVVGILCAHRVRTAMKTLRQTDSASGKRLLLQIVFTTFFVFATSLLRASYSIWQANAEFNSNEDSCNSKFICSSCHNDEQLMLVYELYTPEIYAIVELISYPVTLLVALWGMTSERILRLMKNRQDSLIAGTSMNASTRLGTH